MVNDLKLPLSPTKALENLDCSWNFYFVHQDVVQRAIRKAGINRYSHDFLDYLSDGIINFVKFHHNWQKPLKSEQQIDRFLRLVFIHIKLRTIDTIRHRSLGGVKTEIKDQNLPSQNHEVDDFIVKHTLQQRCTPQELAIIKANSQGYSQREIAKRLKLSESRVSQMVKKIKDHLKHDLGK